MTVTKILTDEQIINVVNSAPFDEIENAGDYPHVVARAIEQAVLQSPEIQALRKDAERLDWLLENSAVNPCPYPAGEQIMNNNEVPPRWYMVTKDGLATLCADEEDARSSAAEADELWPNNAPHTAVQLAPVRPAMPADEWLNELAHLLGRYGLPPEHLETVIAHARRRIEG